MLNGRKLVADSFCDIHQLIEPWIDDTFWDLSIYDPPMGSVCVVGRKQTVENIEKIKHLSQTHCRMVFANSAEGSSTQISQLRVLGIEDHVLREKILLLTGGRLPNQYPHLLHEHFLVRIMAYQENIQQMAQIDEIFQKKHKPYFFLFLNGRGRPHRKYLWHRFRENSVLDKSIWTMMDGRGSGTSILSLKQDGVEILSEPTPIRSLPTEYEVQRYRRATQVSVDYPHQYVKFDVFNDEWGEIYLESAPYIDSYFSVVTETILEYPYSFFTEKIAKPLAMGHPWIAATNQGFYRDIKNLGFRTFAHVIDESFDSIDNDQSRMDRIVDVVTDLCQQDLDGFLAACEDICKYNQQQLLEVARQENQSFPKRFFQFIDQHE
jgi:hypothetical protein